MSSPLSVGPPPLGFKAMRTMWHVGGGRTRPTGSARLHREGLRRPRNELLQANTVQRWLRAQNQAINPNGRVKLDGHWLHDVVSVSDHDLQPTYCTLAMT